MKLSTRFPRSFFLGLLAASMSLRVPADFIETIAGNGQKGYSGEGLPALDSRLDNPFGVIEGPDGALYFCEYTGHRIRKIASDGTVHTIAGTGKAGYRGDGGPALQATLNKPHEIRFDRAGDLYFTDMANHVIRKIDFQTMHIRTIAGNGQPGYAGDGGLATKAQLNQPHSLQFSPAGDLYLCDIRNQVIRKIQMQTGIIETFAGTGKAGPTPNGASLEGTPLNGPRSLDFDRKGNLWLVTREGNQVFRIDLQARRIFHLAGNGQKGFKGNGGLALEAQLSGPKGIAIAPDGRVYLADTESHSVRRLDPLSGILDLVVGTGHAGDGPDGDPLQCPMARLHGIAFDSQGRLLIGDSEAHRIRRLRIESPGQNR